MRTTPLCSSSISRRRVFLATTIHSRNHSLFLSSLLALAHYSTVFARSVFAERDRATTRGEFIARACARAHARPGRATRLCTMISRGEKSHRAQHVQRGPGRANQRQRGGGAGVRRRPGGAGERTWTPRRAAPKKRRTGTRRRSEASVRASGAERVNMAAPRVSGPRPSALAVQH